MITSEQKTVALKRAAVNGKDTGGSSAQVAILSERIKQLTEHLKGNQHDFMARRGLLQLVGKRRRLLRYIAGKDSQKYLDLIQKLGIRR
ncbi:MAG: 30S ribosomal protein S15 [Candidatus Saccharimonadales bacterium]